MHKQRDRAHRVTDANQLLVRELEFLVLSQEQI